MNGYPNFEFRRDHIYKNSAISLKEIAPKFGETQEKKKGIMIFDVFLVFILGIFLPVFASIISDLYFNFGTRVWMFSHHILQMAFALIIIAIPIWKKSFKEFGFNFYNWKWSLKTVLLFVIIILIVLPIYTILTQIFSGWPPIILHDPNFRSYLRTIAFSGTMPGISEEIVFRAMVMGILSRHWSGGFMFGRAEISYSNLISAIIFSLGHVGFTMSPFVITYFNEVQFCFTMVLGLFYGALLEKSKSLLGPILAHNAFNFITITVFYVITLVFM